MGTFVAVRFQGQTSGPVGRGRHEEAGALNGEAGVLAVVDDDFVVDVHHDPMAGRGGLVHGTDQEAAGWELRNSSEVTWRLPLPTAESRTAPLFP